MFYDTHNEDPTNMAAIVYQTDKRSGITYAYQSISNRDEEEKQSLSKSTLVGLLLDKLAVIEYFEQPSSSLQVVEILEQQKRLYENLGVSPPASLCVGGNPGLSIESVISS